MSRGLGALQRDILKAIEASKQYEPQGPYQPYQYFVDGDHNMYHPAQVVRWGWLSRFVAVMRDTADEQLPDRWPSLVEGGIQNEYFKASFSRAMRSLHARKILIPVYIISNQVLRAAAEYPGRPQEMYTRSGTDRYVARNPLVSVNSCWVDT
jgi:hypothetical protein